MIDNQLIKVAEEFIQYLKSSQSVQEFQSVQDVYLNNPEVKKMREEYISLAQKFQQKQAVGTLTQEDINVIRKLQSSMNRHPVTMQYAQAQQAMVMMLQDCNNAMSKVLGFDFSATAAPAASC
jgi:cell fate (sporulation/competence/biofilm development) regulator YlbF (YheA/YmcA/DUF963 family)